MSRDLRPAVGRPLLRQHTPPARLQSSARAPAPTGQGDPRQVPPEVGADGGEGLLLRSRSMLPDVWGQAQCQGGAQGKGMEVPGVTMPLLPAAAPAAGPGARRRRDPAGPWRDDGAREGGRAIRYSSSHAPTPGRPLRRARARCRGCLWTGASSAAPTRSRPWSRAASCRSCWPRWRPEDSLMPAAAAAEPAPCRAIQSVVRRCQSCRNYVSAGCTQDSIK